MVKDKRKLAIRLLYSLQQFNMVNEKDRCANMAKSKWIDLCPKTLKYSNFHSCTNLLVLDKMVEELPKPRIEAVNI